MIQISFAIKSEAEIDLSLGSECPFEGANGYHDGLFDDNVQDLLLFHIFTVVIL
jgi:hypothetical protein